MENKNGLGGLSEPNNLLTTADASTVKKADAEQLLIKMLGIRLAEQKIAEAKKIGQIGGPVHLGVGQEAIAVGISESLTTSDRVFGAHRSHAHLLALDLNFHGLFAEVLGRKTGFSKGMGGSMHLWNKPKGFYGSVPIVAGTVALAVGAGMAAKFQKTHDIGVAYLGDGAVEEGIVQESLNLAKVNNVPVLFVVENNLFSSHMHISLRQPNNLTARFADANEIKNMTIDGNDILSVCKYGKQFIDEIRTKKEPRFLELVTYRWYGHVDWREDIDVGVNRSAEDLNNWKRSDPIERLKLIMIKNGWLSDEKFDVLSGTIQQKILDAWQKALNDPMPEHSQILSTVYFGAT